MMLDEIIINKLREIQKAGLDEKTNKLAIANKNINEFAENLNDKEKSMKLDALIGELYSALADMYFTIGFKDGLKLGTEIKSITSKK